MTYSAERLYRIITGLMIASERSGHTGINGKPFVYANQSKLAAKMGKSLSTVERSIRELKALGLISVKRTRGNGHIYLTGEETENPANNGKSFSVNDGSRTVKNGGYNNPYRDKHNKTDAIASCLENAHSRMCETGSDEPTIAGGIIRKGKPTRKHSRKTEIEKRKAARRRYYEFMTAKMKLHDSYFAWFDEDGSEYRRKNLLCEIVAGAMADSKPIRVNGATLSPGEYWHVVKEIEESTAEETLFRVQQHAEDKAIPRFREYLLSALYNATQVQILTA